MSIRVHYSREPSLTTLQYCIRRFQSRLFFLCNLNCLDMGFLPVECVPALRSREKDFVLVSLVLSSRAPPDAAAPDFFSPWLVSTPNSRWDPPAAARTAMLPSPRREPRTMLVVVRQPRGEQNHIKKITKRITKNPCKNKTDSKVLRSIFMAKCHMF